MTSDQEDHTRHAVWTHCAAGAANLRALVGVEAMEQRSGLPTTVFANPATCTDDDDNSASAGGGVDPKTAQSQTGSLSACPNLLEDLDSLVNKPDGSPTVWFLCAIGTCLAQGLTVLVGTFWAPGIDVVVEARDPLLGAMLFIATILNFIGEPLMLVESRSVVCLKGATALLPKLTIDTACISVEAAEQLKKADVLAGVFHPTTKWVTTQLATCIFCGLFIMTGWGLHSPLHNRLAAVVALLNGLATPCIEAGWTVALKTATAVVNARLDAVSAAVRREAMTEDEDVDDEEWQRTVIAPCRELMHDVELLTQGWSRGVVLKWGVDLLMASCVACAGLSPVIADLLGEANTGVSWSLFVVRGSLPLLVLYFLTDMATVATAPASLSTKCDDLKESLNQVRISDFSKATDERVKILERALNMANHGQGIGSAVLGYVIDMKLLHKLGFQLVAVVSGLAPVVLAASIYNSVPAGSGPTDVSFACELSDTQTVAIRSVMLERNTSCTYNVTLESILAGS